MKIFYLYLIIVLVFLLIFSFFVSLQLKSFVLNVTNLINVIFMSEKNYLFSKKNYVKYTNYYLTNFDYFSCISLSEFLLETVIILKDKKILYTSLASLYSKIGCWTVSEYYYLEAISLGLNDIHILLDLANLYFHLGAQIKLQSICKEILNLYPSYQIPERFVSVN
uniref:Uncharacterized protein n=1 Tax=Polysiphonia sertularioides TaxID=945028 RepID=A0A1Z1M8U1_9FLOR|nr:hypothetical protein [Polysiphonia sertularioides]ARW62390.1 hypothetical protein [Polysiphonia sertularioides]